MSTRAYIGLQNTDHTVTYIYNHTDGDLKRLGHRLNKYFKTTDSVKQLLRYGAISGFYSKKNCEQLCIECPTLYKPDDFYGMSNIMPYRIRRMHSEYATAMHSTLEQLLQQADVEYIYIFEPVVQRWFYLNRHSNALQLLKA